MFLLRSLILSLLVLSGCVAPQSGQSLSWSWPWPSSAGVGAHGRADLSEPGAGRYGQFNFDWQLAGDPPIMPVQVFDDGERMWLQFPPEGAWPAVFDVGAMGMRPVPYRRETPYMVLEGVYPQLQLRGGNLQGTITRALHQAQPGGVPPAVALPERLGPAQAAPASRRPLSGPHSSSSEPRSESVHPAPAALAAPVSPAAVGVPDALSSVSGASALTEASFAAASLSTVSVGQPLPVATVGEPEAVHFTVSPADVTMRQALARWARVAGWTFSAEHWAVDVDIPLVGEADFRSDFKSAVRELVAATEMGDRPLQPCFYSNRVVRVVPYAQACDRRNGMGVMS